MEFPNYLSNIFVFRNYSQISLKMKILLFGEYSNLHSTLAKGLRTLGHEVTVISDGDGFKDYQRDIDISLKNNDKISQLRYLTDLYKILPKLKGYDIVQIINPNFTRIHRINLDLYRHLKKKNGKIFLGAFGDDYFYTKACLENKTYRYSEFFVNGKPTNLKANKDLVHAWMNTFRQKANIEIADTCDGIIACLCEYYMAYEADYKSKLKYIPLPIDVNEIHFYQLSVPDKIRFFIGVNRVRMEVKGTNLFLEALAEIEKKYKNEIEISTIESLPYREYKRILDSSDVVLDQTYSYSVAMNGLLSLSSGKVLMSGAQPEMYEFLNEHKNYPVVNILPTVEDIYSKMEKIIQNKQQIPQISADGRTFVEQHHDHIKVAKEYLKTWESCL